MRIASEPQIRVREEQGGAITLREEPLAGGKAAPPVAPLAGAPQTVTSAAVRRYRVRQVKLQLQWGTEPPLSAEFVVGDAMHEP